MKKRIAINGMGRIGRLCFKGLLQHNNMDIVAVNDIAPADSIAYLLRHCSEHGSLPNGFDVRENNGILELNGRPIPTFQESDARKLPWKELQIDLVLECTGSYTSQEKSQSHLDAGAKRVLISAAASGDIPTVVYGINEQIITESDSIISGASCSTVGLAPLARCLNEISPIEHGISTTIHALTPTQMALDNPQRKRNLRRSRTAGTNIIPTTAAAAKAVGLVIPELFGKLSGSAIRVPVTKGSYIQLIASVCADELSVELINSKMQAMCTGLFGYADEELVSSDIANTEYESIFDPYQTKVQPIGERRYLVETATWFDNETSYVSHFIKLADVL